LGTPKNSFFTIVYHGRLGRFYDLNSFIEVIKILEKLDSGIKFLLIGDFPLKLMNLKVSNIKILPMMELKDLSQNLAKCHLGICLLKNLPAMKNAFPAKSYDFIGAGLPQIVGPVGEFCDKISEHKTGIVVMDINPQEIAKRIISLKNDKHSLMEMRANVLRIRKLFGRRGIAKTFFHSIETDI
jgi:glycosyltransferase involved in cell wall biosynthesis